MNAMPLPDPFPTADEATKALFRPSFAIVNGDYTPHTVPAGRCEQDFIAPKHARESP
jgi:hypothetical protein